MRASLLLGLCIYMCVGCIVKKPFQYPEEKIAVQGWINSIEQQHEVYISRISRPGTDPSTVFAPLNIQELFVEDNIGLRYPYEAIERNHFRSKFPFKAEPKYTYRLRFTWQGYEYASSYEAMIPAPEIEFQEIRPTSCPEGDNCYRVFVGFHDDPERRNYYRWSVYIGDKLVRAPPTEEVFSDVLFDGGPTERKIGPMVLESGEQVDLHLWTLSQEGYRYLQTLLLQTQGNHEGQILLPFSETGNFSALQETPLRVIGYFGVSDIKEVLFNVPGL